METGCRYHAKCRQPGDRSPKTVDPWLCAPRFREVCHFDFAVAEIVRALSSCPPDFSGRQINAKTSGSTHSLCDHDEQTMKPSSCCVTILLSWSLFRCRTGHMCDNFLISVA